MGLNQMSDTRSILVPGSRPPTDTLQTPLSNDALYTDAAWNFSRRSFRLETLDNYDVTGDDRLFLAHSMGEKMPEADSSWRTWFGRLKAEVSAGKQFDRIHLVPSELTPYLKYEIGWAYKNWNAPSGERVFILERNSDPWVRDLKIGDFFLFDDRCLALINYDQSGRWTDNQWEQAEKTVAWYREVQDALLQRATPLNDYLVARGLSDGS